MDVSHCGATPGAKDHGPATLDDLVKIGAALE